MSPLVFYLLLGLVVALTRARSPYYGYFQPVHHQPSARCDTVFCRVGLHCQVNDEGMPQCVPKYPVDYDTTNTILTPCAAIRCSSGSQCVVSNKGMPQCVRKPSAEHEITYASLTPCANVECSNGRRCVFSAKFVAQCIETDKAGECPLSAREVSVV